jgi:hypothetical protein
MFLDTARGVINFEYFREYFEGASLPIELAKRCLEDHYSQFGQSSKGRDFVKFVRLSTLKTRDRLPAHAELREELVDYRDIDGFTLAGPLSMWGGKDIFATTPCIFISHRWQSPDHPDPDGSHLRIIIDRLEKILYSRASSSW